MTYIQKMEKELEKSKTQEEKDFLIYQIEVEKMMEKIKSCLDN